MKVPVRRLPQTQVSARQQGFARAAPGLDVSPITDAIEGFRNQLVEEQTDRQKFDLNKRFMKEVNDLQTDFEVRKRDPEVNPVDFADTVNASYAERHKALVDGLYQEGFSRDLIEEMDVKLGTARQGFFEKGLVHQLSVLKSRALEGAGDLAVTSSQYVSSDYRNYASAKDAYQESIRYTPDLTEPERVAEEERGLAVIRDGAMKAMAIQDPGLVISTLDPQGLTAPYKPVTAPTASGQAITVAPNSWQGVATSVASELGLDPVEVAAVMSYETAGTFSPTILGGKGGNYMGLIQFGREERQKYGITENSTPEEWAGAILSFMRDRGFKRGMSLLDFYSTINAGSPGQYNASDGPGNTVRGHVDKLLSEHKGKAAQWLGAAAIEPAAEAVGMGGSQLVPAQPKIPGNLPLDITQQVKNEDGSISTVRTISFGTDEGEVLIPTVIDGKVVSDEEAIAHYEKTGENFGTFENEASATEYAKKLSESHGAQLENPLLKDLSGPERLQLLSWAREQQNKVRATAKAELDVRLGNIRAEAFTGDIATPLVSDEELLAAYGPVEGPQRIAEQQQLKDISRAIPAFRTQSAATIDASLAALRPQPGSPTYATELQIYEGAQKAAEALLADREKDPAAYALKHFPSLQAASQKGEAQYYAELDRVYEALGIDPRYAPVLPAQAMERLVEDYKTMTPSQRREYIRTNFDSMGVDRFKRLVKNMEGTTAADDARIFALMANRPGAPGEWANAYHLVLEGREIMAKDPARRPSSQAVTQQFQAEGLSAINSLNADASRAIQEAAIGLYAAKNGDPKNIDPKLYRESLATALGGSLPVRMGSLPDHTILPVKTSRAQFENFVDGLSFERITRMSVEKRPPRYGDLKTPVPIEDIIDEGVFVMTSPGRYMIKMSSDGKPLMTSTGKPFLVNIEAKDIPR